MQCTTNLSDRMVEHFRPYRERRAELEQDPKDVPETLERGLETVRPIVAATMDAVRAGVGLT